MTGASTSPTRTTIELPSKWVIGHGGFFGEIELAEPDHEAFSPCLGGHRPLAAIHHLFVHPLRRGMGWGDKLMNAALRYCDRRGADVCLYVRPYGSPRGRLRAEALTAWYASFGFEPVLGEYDSVYVRRWRG